MPIDGDHHDVALERVSPFGASGGAPLDEEGDKYRNFCSCASPYEQQISYTRR